LARLSSLVSRSLPWPHALPHHHRRLRCHIARLSFRSHRTAMPTHREVQLARLVQPSSQRPRQWQQQKLRQWPRALWWVATFQWCRCGHTPNFTDCELTTALRPLWARQSEWACSERGLAAVPSFCLQTSSKSSQAAFSCKWLSAQLDHATFVPGPCHAHNLKSSCNTVDSSCRALCAVGPSNGHGADTRAMWSHARTSSLCVADCGCTRCCRRQCTCE
jgi:hypothetical protein